MRVISIKSRNTAPPGLNVSLLHFSTRVRSKEFRKPTQNEGPRVRRRFSGKPISRFARSAPSNTSQMSSIPTQSMPTGAGFDSSTKYSQPFDIVPPPRLFTTQFAGLSFILPPLTSGRRPDRQISSSRPRSVLELKRSHQMIPLDPFQVTGTVLGNLNTREEDLNGISDENLVLQKVEPGATFHLAGRSHRGVETSTPFPHHPDPLISRSPLQLSTDRKDSPLSALPSSRKNFLPKASRYGISGWTPIQNKNESAKIRKEMLSRQISSIPRPSHSQDLHFDASAQATVEKSIESEDTIALTRPLLTTNQKSRQSRPPPSQSILTSHEDHSLPVSQFLQQSRSGPGVNALISSDLTQAQAFPAQLVSNTSIIPPLSQHSFATFTLQPFECEISVLNSRLTNIMELHTPNVGLKSAVALPYSDNPLPRAISNDDMMEIDYNDDLMDMEDSEDTIMTDQLPLPYDSEENMMSLQQEFLSAVPAGTTEAYYQPSIPTLQRHHHIPLHNDFWLDSTTSVNDYPPNTDLTRSQASDSFSFYLASAPIGQRFQQGLVAPPFTLESRTAFQPAEPPLRKATPNFPSKSPPSAASTSRLSNTRIFDDSGRRESSGAFASGSGSGMRALTSFSACAPHRDPSKKSASTTFAEIRPPVGKSGLLRSSFLGDSAYRQSSVTTASGSGVRTAPLTVASRSLSNSSLHGDPATRSRSALAAVMGAPVKKRFKASDFF